jgi:DNA polymerase III subunit delta
MKVAPRDLARFLRSAEESVSAVLFYGPDQGLVRERAVELIARVAGDVRDPFRVAELTPVQLKEDPVRLADEAAALSLTGGRRVLRLREAGDGLAQALGELLEETTPAAFLVLEAGDLGPRSSLRGLFERLPRAAAVPCYLDDEAALQQVIAEWLKTHRLTADREAVDFLLSRLGGDRGVTRQELEKLALYLGPGPDAGAAAAGSPGARRLTLAEAAAVVGDSSALTLEDLALALADGDSTALDRAYGRALEEGSDAIAILRAAARHLLRLHQVASAEDARAALKALRPPVFYKLEQRYLAQLRLWPALRLAEALDRLIEAEARIKTNAQPKDAIAERALLEVAGLARAAASRPGR